MDHISALSKDLQLRILSFLDAKSVLSLGCCSREWFRLTACEQALWQGLCERDLACSPMRRHVQHRRAAGACWRAAYRSAAALQALDSVAWEDALREAGTSRPRRREGHAACSWGRSGMLVSGGFGGGIISDLHLLLPGCGDTEAAFRWVRPQLAGTPPMPRYGHTLTRCGPNGDMAVLFGGLMAGGYQGPLDTLAVLRRRQPGEGGGKRGGREQETSLGRRLGGQLPGLLMQMLFAQQLIEDMQGWEDEGEGTDGDNEGDEDESEDSEGDGVFDTAAAAAMAAAAAREGSSSDDGSSDGDGGSDGSSESDGVSGDGRELRAAAGAPRPRRSQGWSDGGSSSGDSGDEGARRRSVLAALLAGGDGGSPRAGHSPAAGWLLEEGSWLAEGEGEWWYPPVSGEAPGARGYHSAAASEDGRKIYFFGGLAEQGACASLAVLDVDTWELSRPATTGVAPGPRLGHSSCVFGGRLWVVGGGSGRDLLRSGRDLDDVCCLDLETMEWSCVPVSGTAPLCAGKCHASVLVGRRLLFFAGSMYTCSELAWLDLEQLAWGRPSRVAGGPPHERMSATAVLGGDGKVLVFGGYTFAYREVADLHVLDLQPAKCELKRLLRGERLPGGRPADGRRSWRGFWR